MIRYIIRRLVQAIPTLIGISMISFLLIHTAPGDPVLMRTFDPTVDRRLAQEMRVLLQKQLGLDQPLALQYIRWFTGLTIRTGNDAILLTSGATRCGYIPPLNLTLCDSGGGVIRGDLGTSLQTRQPVWTRIVERFPATLELGVGVLLVSLLLGIPLGILSAIYQGSLLDNGMRVLAVIGNAIPIFWLALMVIFLFSVTLGWLPTGGRSTISLNNDFNLFDRLRHMILPVAVLSLGGIAGISRFVRTETLEVARHDYIRTARAKGLPRRKIWFIHVLRNALIPLMTILGPAITGVLAGAVIIETIFTWPGMGRLTFDAAMQRDYPTVLGLGLLFSALAVLGNLLSDVLYTLVDPRVRFS